MHISKGFLRSRGFQIEADGLNTEVGKGEKKK